MCCLQREPIVPEDGPTSFIREVSIFDFRRYSLQISLVCTFHVAVRFMLFSSFSCGSDILHILKCVIVILQTTIPVRDIVGHLKKEGFDVMESYDAGRFVCNYVYFHSLRQAQKNGVRSLFVHVPMFVVINEERQLQFIAALLKVLATFC